MAEISITGPDKKLSYKSGPVILSLGIVFFLSMVEIGYFAVCTYIFNDFAITAGSSVLVGYSIYSFIKFIPRVKSFLNKPLDYLKEKTKGMDKGLHVFMSILEIAFCSYVLIKILMKYRLFN